MWTRDALVGYETSTPSGHVEGSREMEPPALLRGAATTLGLSDRTLSTAAAYAASCSNPLVDDAEASHCAAALFLAAKTCEEPRRIRDVLNATHLSRTHELLTDSQAYWARKEQLTLGEQRLLRALGYDTACTDAQVLLLNALRAFGAPRALYELSVAMLNDGAGACACLPARVSVAAAITLGAAALEVPLPAHWQRTLEVDGDPQALAAACHAMLDAYDRPAPRHTSERTELAASTRETTPTVSSAQ